MATRPHLAIEPANQDGTTNVSDVQSVINQALGLKSPTNDLNADGVLNVVDVQIDINAVLGLGCGNSGISISGFSPQSGPIGTPVTVTGSNFGSAPQISMVKQGGGAIGQPVASASATAVNFVVAAGTATGAITLTSGNSSVSSTAAFTVTAANTFGLAASPPSANLINGTERLVFRGTQQLQRIHATRRAQLDRRTERCDIVFRAVVDYRRPNIGLDVDRTRESAHKR